MSVINTIVSALTFASATQQGNQMSNNGNVANCIKFPNGTDTVYHFYNCNHDTQLQVLSLNVTDDTGHLNYPLDVSKKIIVNMVSQNDGGTCNKVLVDVTMSYWGGLMGCNWHILPTLGLLKNIDACKIAKDCPLGLGRIDFVQPVDLTPYAAIITRLGGGTVYQLEMHTKCADTHVPTLINCSKIQGLLK